MEGVPKTRRGKGVPRAVGGAEAGNGSARSVRGRRRESLNRQRDSTPASRERGGNGGVFYAALAERAFPFLFCFHGVRFFFGRGVVLLV